MTDDNAVATHVLLGFEDEAVTDKNIHLVNFMTNKVGGSPDVPENIELDTAFCSSCHLPQPLLIQIYAPIENLNHYRVLYVFACINPKCWNISESWTCLRVQSPISPDDVKSVAHKSTAIQWCAGSEDWNDDNENARNGNIIGFEKISDNEEESSSLDDSIELTFDSLTVDDNNSNKCAQDGAVGKQNSPMISAEIEEDEEENVTIDFPTLPQNNIESIFNEATPVEVFNYSRSSTGERNIQFLPFFISVWEENINSSATNDKHVKDLYDEYQHRENSVMSKHVDSGYDMKYENQESYEKEVPVHGDKMFHRFLSRIQMNPGQILRYCRSNEGPLLYYPNMEAKKRCDYCKEEKIFEFQILSTIIPKLRNQKDSSASSLEFGTALIYTCKNNCWAKDVQFRRETVIIQKEV